MANLTYAQLEGVWLQAAQGTKYATQEWAALMAAIAEAESGGNPAATNPTDNNGTQTSWGLWQISLGNHDAPDPNWNNPVVNAQLAIGKLEGQGLTAWGTYDSGAYKAYLSGSTSPDTTGNYSSDVALASSTAAAAQLDAQKTAAQNCAWGIGFGFAQGGGFLSGLLSALTTGTLSGLTSGQVCLISKPQVRALAGWGLILGGSVVAAGGLSLLLTAAGLGSRAGQAVLAVVPGGRAVAGVASARSRTTQADVTTAA